MIDYSNPIQVFNSFHQDKYNWELYWGNLQTLEYEPIGKDIFDEDIEEMESQLVEIYKKYLSKKSLEINLTPGLNYGVPPKTREVFHSEIKGKKCILDVHYEEIHYRYLMVLEDGKWLIDTCQQPIAKGTGWRTWRIGF